MNNEDLDLLVRLLREQRWAALATTQDDGAPYVSFVAYALEHDLGGILLHLSRLASHTGYLLARPRAALGVSLADEGVADPQTLPRLTVEGRVVPVERDSPGYGAARACYLERLPTAERLFGFADFVLLRLEVEMMRYVGGFARAHTVSGAHLRQWAQGEAGSGGVVGESSLNRIDS